jgi:glycerol kinase
VDRSCILAIDQGTSATKTVIFDRQGEVVCKASAPLASAYPRPGFVEQDPEAIYRSVIDSVRLCLDALRGIGRSARDLTACGISNQRETFLLWDEAGRPITPAVVWQCKRSVAVCERLRAQGLGAEIQRRTGLIIDPYFSATKLLWLVDNDPAVRHAVRSGRARFGTVDSWLLYRLTRGACHATDYTNASRTLLFDIEALGWDPWLLREWGLEALRLPTPRPSSFPYGESDFYGLLARPLPISAVIGDSHAAAFGEGCFSPGTAKATLGTGSSLLMNVGSRRMRTRGRTVSTICWSTADRVDYALEGIVVSAGSTLAWLRDALGLFADARETEAMARAVPDSGGVHLVPGFSGMGAPWWRMDARGAVTGLTFGTTRNHIVRAALESVPYQVADVITAMEADSGVRLAELATDGGITANGFVMQLLADLVGAPVVTMGLEEVSALGAALLAGLGAGIYRDVEELAGLDRPRRVLLPGPGAAAARERHAEWREAVAKAL